GPLLQGGGRLGGSRAHCRRTGRDARRSGLRYRPRPDPALHVGKPRRPGPTGSTDPRRAASQADRVLPRGRYRHVAIIRDTRPGRVRLPARAYRRSEAARRRAHPPPGFGGHTPVVRTIPDAARALVSPGGRFGKGPFTPG